MKKKFLSLALALVMCLSLAVPAMAEASKAAFAGGNWNMVTEEPLTLHVTDLGTGYTRTAEILFYFSGESTLFSVRNEDDADDALVYVYYLRCDYITEPVTVQEEGGEPHEIKDVYYGVLRPAVLTDRTDLPDTKPEDYTPAGDGLYWVTLNITTFSGDYVQENLKTLRSDEVIQFNLPQPVGNDAYFQISTCTYYPSENGYSSQSTYVLVKGAEAPETPTAPDVPVPTTPPDFVPPVSAPEFTDVAENAYYAAPVAWAVENDVTAGTSATTFSPANPCTQQQILTFLYRAQRNINGTPAPASSQDLIDALQWADEKGMIDASFDPEATCTRATAVSYIWQAMGEPEAAASSFTDVPAAASYAAAVNWAVEKGVTSGTGNGKFSPDNACDRGTIMTFLYRAFAQ